MENQADSKKTIINYGLILAGISIIILIAKYALGATYSKEFVSGTLSILCFIAIVILGIKKYRELNNGFLTWAQGVKVGVGIAIICALLVGIYQFIFMNYIEPDYMNKMLEMQSEAYLDAGLDEDQVEASIEMSKKFMNPIISIAMGVVGSAIGGFIVSAIAAATMKKEENAY